MNFCVVHFYRYYSDRGTCSKCYLSCATCSGPRRDQCVTCPKDWQLASGECHPSCPMGFFKSEFGCQKCHHYCKTCSGKFRLHIFYCISRTHLVATHFIHVECTQIFGCVWWKNITRQRFYSLIFILSFLSLGKMSVFCIVNVSLDTNEKRKQLLNYKHKKSTFVKKIK